MKYVNHHILLSTEKFMLEIEGPKFTFKFALVNVTIKEVNKSKNKKAFIMIVVC